jgi:hypothetical protein
LVRDSKRKSQLQCARECKRQKAIDDINHNSGSDSSEGQLYYLSDDVDLPEQEIVETTASFLKWVPRVESFLRGAYYKNCRTTMWRREKDQKAKILIAVGNRKIFDYFTPGEKDLDCSVLIMPDAEAETPISFDDALALLEKLTAFNCIEKCEKRLNQT